MALPTVKQKIASRKRGYLYPAGDRNTLFSSLRQKIAPSRSFLRRRLKNLGSFRFSFPLGRLGKYLGKRASVFFKPAKVLGSPGTSEEKGSPTAPILSFLRHNRQWVILAGLGMLAIFLTLLVSFIIPEESPVITLPEDPALFSQLLGYASVEEEFDGQGSGDLLPVAAPYLPAVSMTTYTIQRGDTLSAIARKHELTVRTLIGYNSITDVYTLLPGMELQIPNTDGIPYQVQRGDSLESIARSFNIDVNDLVDSNDLASSTIQPGDNLFIPGGKISSYEYKKALKTLFIYPSSGRFTSGFGYRVDPFTGARRFHYAIDLANRTGTPVLASQGGVVIGIQNRTTGYGKTIILRHFASYQTLYAHLDKILVRKGESVKQGQMIGKMGNTGRSTGPHLHFAVYKNNIPVDPLIYLHK